MTTQETQLELATLVAKKLARAGFNTTAPEWMAAKDGSTAVVTFGGGTARLTITFGRLSWNLANCDDDDKADILRIARAAMLGRFNS